MWVQIPLRARSDKAKAAVRLPLQPDGILNKRDAGADYENMGRVRTRFGTRKEAFSAELELDAESYDAGAPVTGRMRALEDLPASSVTFILTRGGGPGSSESVDQHTHDVAGGLISGSVLSFSLELPPDATAEFDGSVVAHSWKVHCHSEQSRLAEPAVVPVQQTHLSGSRTQAFTETQQRDARSVPLRDERLRRVRDVFVGLVVVAMACLVLAGSMAATLGFSQRQAWLTAFLTWSLCNAWLVFRIVRVEGAAVRPVAFTTFVDDSPRVRVFVESDSTAKGLLAGLRVEERQPSRDGNSEPLRSRREFWEAVHDGEASFVIDSQPLTFEAGKATVKWHVLASNAPSRRWKTVVPSETEIVLEH